MNEKEIEFLVASHKKTLVEYRTHLLLYGTAGIFFSRDLKECYILSPEELKEQLEKL